MDNVKVKKEIVENLYSLVPNPKPEASRPISVIDLSSSDSDSDSSDSDDDAGVGGKRSRVSTGGEGVLSKKKKLEELGVVLPVGFLDPLPPKVVAPVVATPQSTPTVDENAIVCASENVVAEVQNCKQFWKAGDYEGAHCGDWDNSSGGMDHVRVHPKFLHSNATSHKWVLGAFAELLDNALDEVCYGATYVNIDMIENNKDGSRMLLIEDNGGGMDPDKMRQCMSLGYSVKSKVANTIGQYGNGFKTSTMRLGADVIVFSRCSGKNGKRPSQSIGLLSYTFLKSTGKEDIVVPMLDYERGGQEWNKMMRSSAIDWNRNVETIVRWSPFSSETDLLLQFNRMKDQGTCIIIYNLWEDDQGQLELDFDADPNDIQIRGVNRDEKNIQMAKTFPNSRHFLTYRHSLRSYASILYLRVPPGFRIILRGKDVEHHNVVNDMMMTQEVTYRPQPGADGIPKDSNMVAVVTIGFVKDAKAHIDVQGFNVYHKNRLIKPFWRLWNAAGSDGRGVIGVLEANFVEPAHDKQGFERTTVLSRLETRLVQMQKNYWSTYCHKIGYAPRRNKKATGDGGSSPDYTPQMSSKSKKNTASIGKTPVSSSDKLSLLSYQKQSGILTICNDFVGSSPDCTPHMSSKSKKNAASISKTPVSGSDKFSSLSYQKQNERESGKYAETLRRSHRNGHLYGEGENGSKTPTKYRNRPSFEPLSPSADVSGDDVQTIVPVKEINENSHKSLTAKVSSGREIAEQACSAQGDDVNGSECSPSTSSSQYLNQLRDENLELKERLKRKEEEILGDLLHDLQSERERCKSLEGQLQEATKKIEELNKEQESLIDIFSEERERRDIEEENLRKKLKDASNTIEELLDKVRLLERMKSP